MQRFFQFIPDVGGILHGNGVFSNRAGQRNRIGLLFTHLPQRSIQSPRRAQQFPLALPRNYNHGQPINKGTKNPGQGIDNARPGRHLNQGRFARDMGITFGRQRAGLFMLATHNVHAIGSGQGVVQVHGHTAGQ